jgi:hypothetical protein
MVSEHFDQMPPTARQEVVVGCPGHRHTHTVINRRYLRWRCTQKKCRREGHKTFHIADSLTGRLVRTEYERIQPELPAHEGV